MGSVREQEPDGLGGLVTSRTYFLVGSECRFTCSMCDLWKYTLEERATPRGSFAVQIENLNLEIPKDAAAPDPEWIKLYNASNFFDPANVDPQEYEAVAKGCAGFSRVIVENHASMLCSAKTQELVKRFRDLVDGQLEVAMGLETIDPQGMHWLNKAMSLEQFEQAVEFLRDQSIFVRAFVLLQPLGTPRGESVDWAVRSSLQAIDWGVHRVCVIPTRSGNGFVESLVGRLGWEPPEAWQLEQALARLLDKANEKLKQNSSRGIYTVDLWDWELMRGTCPRCSQFRLERLQQMNYSQSIKDTKLDIECSCVRVPG
jgi:radical SAM enzyme (TIGR01210 family)